MKKLLCALLGVSLLASAVQTSSAVDAVWNYPVEASATVQASPPQITLNWPQDSVTTPSSYTIYRKTPSATSWGNPIATLSGSQLSYTDTSANVGTIYDYQIVKNCSALGYYGYGYVESAIAAPLVDNRGKVILVVDNTYAAQLTNELARLQQDLVGDGWMVIRHDVSRTASVVSVKNLIKADYNADPSNVKSVFLFGHVPVPYSGQMNPDGHPDHVGAWPSDVFYGVMNDSGFTDSSVNFAQTVNTDPADAARLSNFPGDGKYDQVQIPANVDLQVGRVDLANMLGQLVWGGPATFKSELELLRQYLNKDHNYRVKTLTARRRAFIGDYFGSRGGEAFSSSAFGSAAAFFGVNNIDNANVMYNDQQGTWVPYLAQNDYLFAYGCGAGSYSGISGLGNAGNYNATSTPEIVNNDIRAVFVNFFGSWLGDWDHSDNIMRAVLATPTYGLACAWSGRPHWFMFPMALGQPIGYTAKLTQNNNGLFQNQINSAANDVHIALMGDPTLRLHQMTPPTSVNGTASGNNVNLTWNASSDATLGYYVYRSASAAGPFTRISSSLVNGTSFTDSSAPAGSYYMVRAIKLETSASGTYTNASEGTFWPANGNFVSTGGGDNSGGSDDSGDGGSTNTNPSAQTVTVSASSATAVIGGTSNAALTFVRTGDTSSALTVNFALGGTAVKWMDYRTTAGDMPVSITIPAGSPAATMSIVGITNTMNANPETATFTLMSDPGYTVGSQNNTTVTILPAGSSGSGGDSSGGSDTNSSGGSSTNSPGGGSTNVVTLDTNAIPGSGPADYLTLHTPKIGDTTLHVLSPTLLELHLINTLPQGASSPTNWNFVNNFNLSAPATGSFTVTANGQNISVTGVGFKRRAISAPIAAYDLRMDNVLYLQLASPIADNATVQVTNANHNLWSANTQFATTADPLRYSPAIHVNQEGYEPSLPKKAIIGYYLGNLGEMPITAATFSIVDAKSGAQVFSGTLTQRKDAGYTYSPTPYQTVYEADFSSFTTPGQYRLEIPGMGASLPFLIQNGIAMDFARTYALGIFEQRSGFNVAMPYTRFTHVADHTAPASVPTSASAYSFTWNCISNYAIQANADNPTQTAPLLTSPAKQLFPFINQGPIDVSGGHFDAGDYSKYTWDMAQLVHVLVFSADSLPGVGQLDNLGIPESGDGISDVLQEAKWEADSLAKLQDSDGGFYYVVYPQNSEYEGGSLPENGSPQVVWPKQTAATAAAVAALAQIASSPAFKAAYPQVAAGYLAKAKLGWQFLTNAIAKYGKTGAYQKMMHFGDDFTDQDDEAWAACEMFLATGDTQYQTTLKSWFPDPTSTSTFRWGWWKMFGSWGNAVRDYAFVVKSGRLQASQIDSAYQAKCINTITNCANDQLKWSQDNAYGSSFPDATKAVRGAGWYYSPEQAFDITVGYQFNPDPKYLDAIVRNINFEGGCNPVNVTYVTGLGIKRQREVVDQYSANDRHVLSKDGIPIGNIQGGFVWTGTYASALEAMDFPSDDASSAPYPYYDRWGDSWNVTTEASTDDTVKNFATAAALAAATSFKTQAWTYANGNIIATNTPSQGQPMTVSLNAPGMDLSGARIVWEAQGAEPSYGSSFTFTPTNYGSAWIEAEAQWPDGRRVFAVTNFFAVNSLPTVSVSASIPNAQLGTTNYGMFTFTTASPVTNTITVNFQLAGSAVKWDDYRTPNGDMPQTITIPKGTSSTNLLIKAIGNESGANPETVLLTLSADPNYNLGSTYFTTMTITTNYITTTNSNGGGTTNSTGGGDSGSGDSGGSSTNSSGGSTYTNSVWVDDSLPTGAGGASDGGDSWTWISSGPAPFSGKSAHQSALKAGLHEHYFNWASQTLTANSNDTLFAYVYLDPANPPTEIMIGWNTMSGSWEHRAYWGANKIDYGTDGTASRHYMGALPATGGWVRLEVPASAVGFNGETLQGMDYALYDGKATWDYAGKAAISTNSPGGGATNWTSTQMLAASVHVNSLAKVANNGGMKLTWPTTSGKTYGVAYKTNLTDATWTPIGSDMTATGTNTSWTDASTTNVPQRFYIIYQKN